MIRFRGTLAPSLVELSHFLTVSGNTGSIFAETSADVDVQWNDSGWNVQQVMEKAHPPRVIVDYGARATKSIGNASSTQTSYGFRRNDKKTHLPASPRAPFHVATAMLLGSNLVVFFCLWNFRIDPSQVALNGQIYHDFGRAVTGNLSHFEIWHLVLNMMSLSNLGPILEQKYGSMPLLLWTVSFLPVLTLLVVGLHHFHRRFIGTRQSPINFPSMVGFSGILFIWMVVATLDGQRSCPIVFLPSLCFDTWELAGIGRVSLGPLVQLIFLQLVLPRVSFLGHLSGVVVGFLWHWSLFPPLEWFQPCVLFPLLWIVGKYLLLDLNSGAPPQQSAGNPWAKSTRCSSISDLASFKTLFSLYIMLFGHFVLQVFHDGFPYRATSLSQFLLIAILFRMIRIDTHNQQKDDTKKQFFGVMGRGYVTLAGILLATDGLTIGGWMATWTLWTHAAMTDLSLIVTRDILVILSISSTVQTLNSICESSTVGGTWPILTWPWAGRLPSLFTLKELPRVPFLECFPCSRKPNRETPGTHSQSPVPPEQCQSTELV